MLKHKRGHMKLKPVVAFGEDFSIDWGRCGLYELTGAVEKGGERLWSHLVHKPTGTKVFVAGPRAGAQVVGESDRACLVSN